VVRGQENESNSRIDLAFGAIRRRAPTAGGIAYDTAA
jgi:hypothetical protein